MINTSHNTIAIVDQLIKNAIDANASDIHLEPFESRLVARIRLDGILYTFGQLDLTHREALPARIKVLAGLDIAEKRRPQDGRLRVEHEGRSIDFRVSVVPTNYGEKVVLRLLDRSAVLLDFEQIGLQGEDHSHLASALASPHGMIVVTGPTGSGKTTTLYAALSTLNHPEVNILTAEDPVEYDLPGVNQTRIRADIGFTFAEALRAFLRQDPDIIMVGEVRDRETAEIAVRASITGHLVLTTLHTNDTATAATRLVDMGVEPYLAAASLRLIVAQRLVRRICGACVEPAPPSSADTALFGASAPSVMRGRGCDACSGTGYKGRIALFEMLPVDDELAEHVAQGASASALRTLAQARGHRTLRDAGREAVQAGSTTSEEVVRATT